MKRAIVLFTMIFLMAGSLSAERFQKGSWTGGLMFGSFKLRPYDLENDITGESTEGYYVGFQLSTYAGHFFRDNWVVGTFVDYELNPSVKTYNDDEDLLRMYSAEADAFLGIYSRYYFPVSNKYAIYPEISTGLKVYGEQYQYSRNGKAYEQTDLTAYGFHCNIGCGLTSSLNDWLSTDFTISYGIGWLAGEDDIRWHLREWKENRSFRRTSFSMTWGIHLFLEESFSILFRKKKKEQKG